MENFETNNLENANGSNLPEESNAIVHKNQPETLENASFYTETYKKPKKRKMSVLSQMVIVAVVSSVLTGSVVSGAFMFGVPALQPSIKALFGQTVTDSSGNGTSNSADGYKKVEIVGSTDSPVTAIAEKVSPSVVGIRTSFKARSFWFDMEQEDKNEGSGIIIRENGYIITNYHVIERALNPATKKMANGAKIEVVLPSRKDKPYDATVVGGDARTDLAVIKIEGTNFPAAELGDSDKLKIGEMAVAIGNPAGLEYMGSVTVGVISGLNRTTPLQDGKELKLIQTDAAINPGNSGGALVNSKGQVIGINSQKIGQQGFEGLGFAIPINKAKEITNSLIEFNYVKGRPTLGITVDNTFDEAMAKEYDVPAGVLVKEVTPLSGAYKGGIQPGDIITKFDGKKVKNINELNEIKNAHKPGDVIEVEVYRDTGNKTLKVTLTEEKIK
ncbi:MAG: trypsin-like peptidase domain-containing protein [Clostridia bacterium]|nr:trypsin-like peptidase domain-containing protein [Clostridia bacterium]